MTDEGKAFLYGLATAAGVVAFTAVVAAVQAVDDGDLGALCYGNHTCNGRLVCREVWVERGHAERCQKASEDVDGGSR